MKQPNIFLDPDYPVRVILSKMQKEKEFIKERWFVFLKHMLISIPYYFIAMIVLLYLFQLIMPSIIFNWLFIFTSTLILSCYYADREAVKHIKQKIEEYNRQVMEN